MGLTRVFKPHRNAARIKECPGHSKCSIHGGCHHDHVPGTRLSPGGAKIKWGGHDAVQVGTPRRGVTLRANHSLPHRSQHLSWHLMGAHEFSGQRSEEGCSRRQERHRQRRGGKKVEATSWDTESASVKMPLRALPRHDNRLTKEKKGH